MAHLVFADTQPNVEKPLRTYYTITFLGCFKTCFIINLAINNIKKPAIKLIKYSHLYHQIEGY